MASHGRAAPTRHRPRLGRRARPRVHGRVVALWTQLLEELPGLPVTRPFAAADVAAPLAVPRPRGADARRRAARPPARARLRAVDLQRAPRLHGLHQRLGHRPGRGGRPARRGPQPQRRRLPARARRRGDRAAGRPLARRAARAPAERRRPDRHGRRDGQLRRAQVRARRPARPRRAGGGRAGAPARDPVRLRGGARGHPPRRGHARPRRRTPSARAARRRAADARGRPRGRDRGRRRRPGRARRGRGHGRDHATGSIDPLPRWPTWRAARPVAARGRRLRRRGGARRRPARPLLAGLERADSVAIDPHKWLYTPQSGGCVLVRDGAALPAPSTPTPPTCGSTRPSARASTSPCTGRSSRAGSRR